MWEVIPVGRCWGNQSLIGLVGSDASIEAAADPTITGLMALVPKTSSYLLMRLRQPAMPGDETMVLTAWALL
jgi:hypothetical protein